MWPHLWLWVLCQAVTSPATTSADMAESTWMIWSVDPLIKVFRDDRPQPGTQALSEVARGEHATLQVVVRANAMIEDLRVSISGLRHENDPAVRLQPSSIRFVGYVHVTQPIPDPPDDRIRIPPADFPDPLLEDRSIDIPADTTQPIWVTLPVPLGTKPGLYTGTLKVQGRIAGRTDAVQLPVNVQVYRAQVGRARLWITNWFVMHAPHMEVRVEPYNDAYWRLARKYARNMADHRQNVARVSPMNLATFEPGADGHLKIDFSNFDKLVEIFIQEGVVGRIEGEVLGQRTGGWESGFALRVCSVEDGKIVYGSVDANSDKAHAFYSQFFPALQEHLRRKGWLERYMQHLVDEPIEQNTDSYRQVAKLIRTYAPDIRVIEALQTPDLAGSVDVWVPQLDWLNRYQDQFLERQKQGGELWFYTCMWPQGEYANRFIEQPLIKTRLLHWINYRYGLTGYLHWGYNYWTAESPYDNPSGDGKLPAGDRWIVYPGRDGPIDSIRFEAMRDGIADHELLSILAEHDPDAAMALAARHVIKLDQYNCDVEAFRNTRRELLERASQFQDSDSRE